MSNVKYVLGPKIHKKCIVLNLNVLIKQYYNAAQI